MRQLRDLILNTFAGTRLALFLPVRRIAFRPGIDQIVILAALAIFLNGYDLVAGATDPEVFSLGLGVVCAYMLGTVLGCYVVSRVQRSTHAMPALLTYILSAEPVAFFVEFGIDRVTGYSAETASPVVSGIYVIAIFVWWVLIFYRAVRLEFPVRRFRAALLAGTQMVCVMLLLMLPAAQPFLYVAFDDNAYDFALAYDEGNDIDVEQIYYSQPALIDRATQFLQVDRPGTVDLYFVGYAGYADHDVFMREVNSFAALFNSRFDTRDRAVVLINNPRTVGHVPLANRHNLAATLERVATKMYSDEDVLFLFLTSQGEPERLTTEFYPFGLGDLGAEDLRGILDASGIKWRIVVVSACYSGGFIEPLKDDHTLIITASREDRTSFRCANENKFTYFGEAYFDQQLRREFSFITAFENARGAIAARERQENLTPSDPQIHIGAAIPAKLDELEQRLRRLHGTALAN